MSGAVYFEFLYVRMDLGFFCHRIYLVYAHLVCPSLSRTPHFMNQLVH